MSNKILNYFIISFQNSNINLTFLLNITIRDISQSTKNKRLCKRRAQIEIKLIV